MQPEKSECFYQLPSGYNENQITVLARDPQWLFTYWEISADNKKNFCNSFGKDMWEKSIPVLKISNISKNENSFVRINEFSSSWYIRVPDSDCLYCVQIGRRIADDFFVNIASSNLVTTPNNSVSSNKNSFFADYRNLEKGFTILKSSSNQIKTGLDFDTELTLAPGSPHMFGKPIEEVLFGISSAGILGINIPEQIGISSETLIR